MKFRSDFVTNSSSTSFVAAIAEVVGVLALSGLFSSCKCGEQEEEGDYQIEISLSKETINADGVDETWVNAKVTSMKDEKAGTYTPEINFDSAGNFGKYVYFSSQQMNGEYMAAKITGITPADGLPDALIGTASIKASAKGASSSATLNVELVPGKPIVFATDPKDATIEIGSEKPVYLCAQITKKDETGNDVVDEAATESITIEITGEAAKWTKPGKLEYQNSWMVLEVYGTNPYGKDVEAAKVKPPEKADVQLSAKIGEATIKQRETIAISAQPMFAFSPDYKVNVVKDSGVAQEVTIEVINPGSENWTITYEADNFANEICDIREVSGEGGDTNKSILKLQITDNDVEDTSEQTITYYSKGKITVKATPASEKPPIEDYMEVTLIREGLAVKFAGIRDTALEINAMGKADENDELESTQFGLRFIKYDAENKTFNSDPEIARSAVFDDPEPAEDEKSQSVFDVYESSIINIVPTGENSSERLPAAMYSAKAADSIPGRLNDVYKATITASLTYNEKEFTVNIPVNLKPDTTGDQAQLDSIEQEYQNCLKTLRYMPAKDHERKYKELQSKKASWGILDLMAFRKECWSIAYDAIMKDKQKADSDAAWFDNAVTVCNVAQWLGDRAFAGLMAAITGPFGAFLAGQLKDAFITLCVQWQESDKSGWAFFEDYAWDRTKNLVGGSIDNSAMNVPEKMSVQTIVGWIVCFYIYKVSWHWANDPDEKNPKERAGLMAAVQSAGMDLVNTGFEKGLEAFIGKSMDKNGIKKVKEDFGKKAADAAKAASEAVTDKVFAPTGTAIKDTASSGASYVGRMMTTILDWLGKQGTYVAPTNKM